MASGVAPNQDCQKAFQSLKLGKAEKYIIFSLNDTSTEIIVKKTSGSADYEEFLKDLPDDEPRWAVYDFEYDAEGGGKRNKLVFVSWNPDGAKIKQKMVYASSKDALRRSLDGIAVEVQGTDKEEVSQATVLEKAKRTSR